MVTESQIVFDRPRVEVDGSEAVYQLFKQMAVLETEHVSVLTLTSQNRTMTRRMVKMDRVKDSPIHPREVFQAAILDGAVKLIVVHNHPSGDPTPTEDDVMITRRLVAAGELLGIEVADHLVIGHESYYSFRDHGRMTVLP